MATELGLTRGNTIIKFLIIIIPIIVVLIIITSTNINTQYKTSLRIAVGAEDSSHAQNRRLYHFPSSPVIDLGH